MKIIELLNRIANGEDIPKKIKYRNEIWEYQSTIMGKCYQYYNSFWEDWIRLADEILLEECLNDEIEIVGVKEETRKRLEFIKYLESEIGCRELISDSLFNHNKELKI